jgi:hypothetical protein
MPEEHAEAQQEAGKSEVDKRVCEAAPGKEAVNFLGLFSVLFKTIKKIREGATNARNRKR